MADLLRLGVLVSGNGTNLQSLLDALQRNDSAARVVVVISNKPGAPALKRAQNAGVSAITMEPNAFENRGAYDKTLAKTLLHHDVELVVLAGFMHILSSSFLRYFPGRAINVHPALLPDDPCEDKIILPDGSISKVFRGKDAVEQTLNAGVAWSGCTVHLVTEKVDAGPVLERALVPVLPGDTPASLHARIQKEEHLLLPKAVVEYGGKIRRVNV